MPEFIMHQSIPLIKTMENFLTDEECRLLIEDSKDKLRDSTLLSYSGYGDIPKGIRSSWSTRKDNNNLLVSKIRNRISFIFDIDIVRFENLEVIHYNEGDEFKPHSDYFKGPSASQACENGGNRIATIIIYLNDVEEGGDTNFPQLNLSIQPKKGNILYFDYSNPDIEVKRRTEHHGKPVIKGEKWIAALWVREFSRTML